MTVQDKEDWLHHHGNFKWYDDDDHIYRGVWKSARGNLPGAIFTSASVDWDTMVESMFETVKDALFLRCRQ